MTATTEAHENVFRSRPDHSDRLRRAVSDRLVVNADELVEGEPRRNRSAGAVPGYITAPDWYRPRETPGRVSEH